MKKALFVATVGGFAAKFEMEDIRCLQEYGCEVHYAANFQENVYNVGREELERQDVHLHNIAIQKKPWQISGNKRALHQLINIIRKEQINVIHCHTPMGGVLARLAALFCGRRVYVVYTAHGFHFYKGAPAINWLIYYPAERLLAHVTDCLITINHEDAARARRFSLRRNGKSVRIPGVGLDRERFYPMPNMREELKRKLEIPADAFHIAMIGELNKNKNQIVVLDALKELKDCTIYCSIWGRGDSKAFLQEKIREYGLASRVRLRGYCENPEIMLQSADCFIFPSLREGLGMAALEAMACGIPVIAADNRGSREYMKAGINGFVCHAGSVTDYVKAIRQMKESAALRQRMSEAARKETESYDIKIVKSIMQSVYRDALEEKRA